MSIGVALKVLCAQQACLRHSSGPSNRASNKCIWWIIVPDGCALNECILGFLTTNGFSWKHFYHPSQLWTVEHLAPWPSCSPSIQFCKIQSCSQCHFVCNAWCIFLDKDAHDKLIYLSLPISLPSFSWFDQLIGDVKVCNVPNLWARESYMAMECLAPLPRHSTINSSSCQLLIMGSIRCDLAMKCGGEAKAHEISKTQKSFGEIPPRWRDIKIINIVNGFLSLNLGK